MSWDQGREGICAGPCGKRKEFRFFLDGNREPLNTHTSASLVVQTVKNLAALQETWVPSWVRKIPLEKGMANHSNILAWRIPWTEESVSHSPWGCKESDTTE